MTYKDVLLFFVLILSVINGYNIYNFNNYEKENVMNFEHFDKCVNEIQNLYAKQEMLSDILSDGDYIDFGNEVCDLLLQTLEIYFEDESEWISYYIYELNFGKKYKDGMITIDDTIVRLSNTKELYNLLMENKERCDEK